MCLLLSLDRGFYNLLIFSMNQHFAGSFFLCMVLHVLIWLFLDLRIFSDHTPLWWTCFFLFYDARWSCQYNETNMTERGQIILSFCLWLWAEPHVWGRTLHTLLACMKVPDSLPSSSTISDFNLARARTRQWHWRIVWYNLVFASLFSIVGDLRDSARTLMHTITVSLRAWEEADGASLLSQWDRKSSCRERVSSPV